MSESIEINARLSGTRPVSSRFSLTWWVAVLGLLWFLAPAVGAESRSAQPRSAINLAGEAVNPLAEVTNKAVVCVFLSSECPISNRYAPELRRLHAKFQPQGIRFWLVYPNGDESAAEVRQHTNDYQLTFGALRDPQHALVRQAKATVTPEVAVFLPDGRLAYHGRIDNRHAALGKERSEATKHDLQDALQAIIKGKRVVGLSSPAVGCYIPEP